MEIDVYKNIPKTEIHAQRHTSEGKPYDLNHNKELIVDMRFRGQNATCGSNVNSQGWERDSRYYFEELSRKHPEYFSERNMRYIQSGRAPVVDARIVRHFPEYKGYENETLVHHHLGGDGQAVAVPKSIHKGFGEIHNVERKAGITKNGQNFSKDCEKYCEKNPAGIGKTAKQLKVEMYRKKAAENRDQRQIEREDNFQNRVKR